MSPHLDQVAARSQPEPPTDEPHHFELFFEANRRRLFGAFVLITGNRHEAEEIVQDAFLKIWERWDRVASMDDPGGFLFVTAMNVFRNRRRRASLALRRSIAADLRSDDLSAVEDRDELIRALRPLTPRQRAALVLTDYLGYGSDEAGSILGVEPSTVRALSANARGAVRLHAGGAR